MNIKVIEGVTTSLWKHRLTWRDRDDNYWFARLVQEVGELGSALVGDHEHPPELELTQIAAICLNWLDRKSTE